MIGLPGMLQPRAAVAYMFVAAAEVAALAGVAPRIVEEMETAAAFLRERLGELRARAAGLGGATRGAVAGYLRGRADRAVARRWKTQINENAKLAAFFSELPEADHNEICGWGGSPRALGEGAVLLEDRRAAARGCGVGSS